MSANNYYLAATYLKLVAQQPEIQQILNELPKAVRHDLLYKDEIPDSFLRPMFKQLQAKGISSWVVRYGRLLRSTSHGPLGFAALSAPDLRSALEVIQSHSIIRTNMFSCHLDDFGNSLIFEIEDETSCPLIGPQMIDAGLLVTKRLIESIMGHHLTNHAEIHLMRSRPAYSKQLSRAFGLSITYDSGTNRIAIPASWGRMKSPLADSTAFLSNITQCREQAIAKRDEEDLVKRIKLEIDHFFDLSLAGEAMPENLPTLSTLAKNNSVSERTLSRRLKVVDSSYKLLLENARKERAMSLLITTHMTIAEIAYFLGYQEPANFIRAFKRWLQVTPTVWRRQTR